MRRRLEEKVDWLDLLLKLVGFLFCWGMDCRRAGNKDLANCFIPRTSQGGALRMQGGMRRRWIERETGPRSNVCIAAEIAISNSPGGGAEAWQDESRCAKMPGLTAEAQRKGGTCRRQVSEFLCETQLLELRPNRLTNAQLWSTRQRCRSAV